MRQDPATRAQPPREGEGGIALVSVMFFTMLMAMLGATLLTSSRTETQISANQLYQTQAFYIAEAGLAQAKAWLDANQTDAELMSALLVESQELNPDQSSLTRPDLTVVATPLGTQPFGNGTVDCAWDDPGCRYYDVVIRDNNDDADLLTDSDSQWVITSRGSGPTNASQFIEIEVLGTPAVTPSGAMSARGNNLNVDFDQSGGGVGSSISPNSFNGNPHDLNGAPLLPGGSCAAVPPLSTDGAQATQSLLDELDDLRSNIVRRANSECDQNGETKCLVPGDTGCCTPGLWWIRGSAVTPILDWMDPASYSLLDLSAPQLHAIDANYVPPSTQPPTMILPDPPTAPLDGAEGNTDDPLVEQVPLADMQDDLNAIQDLIDAYPVAVDITGGNFTTGGTFTYGSATDPKLVTANADLRIRNGTTFTGFGILVADKLLDIRDSTFNWTGIVLVQGNNPRLESRTSTGQLNGALFFDATAGMPTLDMDKNTDNVKITYSCEAIKLASTVAPMQTLGWIELLQ